MDTFRLPDGGETRSAERYIEAWRQFCEPLEKLTGLTHTGFDPGALFSAPDGKRTISLPTWFMVLVNEGLKKGE